jgi:hypothetical protein
MSKRNKRANRRRDIPGPIGWDRVRAIFDNPRPPQTVTERQFDYANEVLDQLARTPHTQIDFHDLWYYHHDLASVELQPDLFDYLFPACLMYWHVSLMLNKSCGGGDIEFHQAIQQGNILEKMVTPERRNLIYEFFRDSFLERLDAERGFACSSPRDLEDGWLSRFNVLGCVIPRIDLLWNAWWSLETPGRAVAALEYCSGLMYLGWDNPLYRHISRFVGQVWPMLDDNPSRIPEDGWMRVNLDFLSATLTAEFVQAHIIKAVVRLEGEPEWEMARQVERDFPESRKLVSIRVSELPRLLDPRSGLNQWSA